MTTGSLRFLLKQGRLVVILDGFDEFSRALAQDAEGNVEELGKDINKNTLGRVLLTSRQSFVQQEEIFSILKQECGQESHEQYELAPYTDDQMHEWVVQNPPAGALQPAERHWRRVETALLQNADIKELCRTPVFLRMLSEVLVKQSSVSSQFDLLGQFCLTMWERERSRRFLTLSDDQYFYAYEAISRSADSELRIEPKEIKTLLELYLEDYCPDLLAGLPAEANTFISDLAIGALTFKKGVLTFDHEVLTGYFLARSLARSLLSRRKIDELWALPFSDTVWRFLPEAVKRLDSRPVDSGSLLSEIVLPARSGLLAWNIIRALKLTPDQYPRNLFAKKRLAGIVFDRVNLSGLSFDNSELLDVVFDNCDLRGAIFRSCSIGKARFFGSGKGAVLEGSVNVQEDSELQIKRDPNAGVELYKGESIRNALREIFQECRDLVPLPLNIADQAAVLIFSSLFKSDMRMHDYPEWSKVENRIRGWLRAFQLSDESLRNLNGVLLKMADEFRREGWISRNRNRPRTFVPAEARRAIISQVLRSGSVRNTSPDLEKIIRTYQQEIDSLIGSE